MKYTRPIKFRRAIKSLVEYIASSEGIVFYKEWRGEVSYMRENTINWHDRAKYDKAVLKLEALGLELSDAWEAMDKKSANINKKLETILRNL